MLWWFAETGLIAALLAVGAALAGRSGRLGPEARHALWLVVLVRLVLPPVVSWPWILPDPWAGRPAVAAMPAGLAAEDPILATTGDPGLPPPPDPVGPGPEMAAPVASGGFRISAISDFRGPDPGSEIWDLQSSIPRLLLAVWLAGTIAVVARRAAGVARFRRTLAGSKPAPAWLADEARAVGERMGIRPPPILVTPGGRTPLLWCPGRPTLLIPSALVDRLARDRWPGILAHELAHLGRRDHWVVRLGLVAEAAWWWNPLFWHVRRRLHDEAEHACDARVVRALPDRRFAYAEALIEVCEHLSRAVAVPSPALGVVGPDASRTLEGRLEMILRDPGPPRPLGRLAALAVATLAALSAPGWTLGQQPEPPRAEASPRPEEPPRADPPRVEQRPAGAPAAEAALAPDDLLLADSPDGAAISGLAPEALRAVLADPEVIAAAGALRRARADLEAVIRRSKSPSEPEEQEARKRLADAAGQYARVWSARARNSGVREDSGVRPDRAESHKLDPRALRDLENDPEFAALRIKIGQASSELAAIRESSRGGADPAEELARKKFESLRAEYRGRVDARSRMNQAARETGAAVARARRDGKAAEVRKAEAQLRLAQAVVARYEALRKRDPKFVSTEEAAKAEAELAIAEAEVDARKAALAEVDATLNPAGPGAGAEPADGGDRAGRPRAIRGGKAAEVARAEAELDRARAVVARNSRLFVDGPKMVSREESEKAEAELAIAEAGLERARAELAAAGPAPGAEAGGESAASREREAMQARMAALDAGRKIAEAKARLAEQHLTRVRLHRQRGAIAQVEVDQAEAAAQAANERAVAERARARAMFDHLNASGPRTAPAAGPDPPRALTPASPSPIDAREAVELLEAQLQGRRAELDGLAARVDLARRRQERVKRLADQGAADARAADDAEAEVRTAEAALGPKKAEVLEYEVRLRQARRRADEAETLLKGDLARAKDRLDWSTEMRKKGYVSEAQAVADRLNYETLLRQVGPGPGPRPKADEPATPGGPTRR